MQSQMETFIFLFKLPRYEEIQVDNSCKVYIQGISTNSDGKGKEDLRIAIKPKVSDKINSNIYFHGTLILATANNSINVSF